MYIAQKIIIMLILMIKTTLRQMNGAE